MLSNDIEESLFDLILTIESNYSKFMIYDKNGSYFPGGWNGPHYALETPIRNSCHWLVTYSILFKLTGDLKFKEKAYLIFEWLDRDNPFYQNGFFINRQKNGQDLCNGVIGNAWIYEAYSIFEDVFNENTKKNEIINNMRFNRKLSLWHRFDAINKNYKIDYTFDHQAWFASSLLIDSKNKFKNNVNSFLQNIRNIISIDENFIVRHICHTKSFKNYLIKLNYLKNKKDLSHNIHVVEQGYNIYSLFPFARMKQYGYEMEEFFYDAFTNIDVSFFEKNIKNRYLFKYNNPVFELPLILLSFPNQNLSENFKQLFKLNEIYFRNGWFNDVDDNLTLASRIYELALYFYHRDTNKCVA